jgi:hypothetical protein
MISPPCIRGLKCFKKGCPQKRWSERDPEGCPAWVELDMKTKGGTDVIEIRECLDLYMSRLMFYNNCLLEGNQQAIESFRNGMVYKDANGDIVPKPTEIEMALLFHMQNVTQKMLNDNYEDPKMIKGD